MSDQEAWTSASPAWVWSRVWSALQRSRPLPRTRGHGRRASITMEACVTLRLFMGDVVIVSELGHRTDTSVSLRWLSCDGSGLVHAHTLPVAGARAAADEARALTNVFQTSAEQLSRWLAVDVSEFLVRAYLHDGSVEDVCVCDLSHLWAHALWRRRVACMQLGVAHACGATRFAATSDELDAFLSEQYPPGADARRRALCAHGLTHTLTHADVLRSAEASPARATVRHLLAFIDASVAVDGGVDAAAELSIDTYALDTTLLQCACVGCVEAVMLWRAKPTSSMRHPVLLSIDGAICRPRVNVRLAAVDDEDTALPPSLASVQRLIDDARKFDEARVVDDAYPEYSPTERGMERTRLSKASLLRTSPAHAPVNTDLSSSASMHPGDDPEAGFEHAVASLRATFAKGAALCTRDVPVAEEKPSPSPPSNGRRPAIEEFKDIMAQALEDYAAALHRPPVPEVAPGIPSTAKSASSRVSSRMSKRSRSSTRPSTRQATAPPPTRVTTAVARMATSTNRLVTPAAAVPLPPMPQPASRGSTLQRAISPPQRPAVPPTRDSPAALGTQSAGSAPYVEKYPIEALQAQEGGPVPPSSQLPSGFLWKHESVSTACGIVQVSVGKRIEVVAGSNTSWLLVVPSPYETVSSAADQAASAVLSSGCTLVVIVHVYRGVASDTEDEARPAWLTEIPQGMLQATALHAPRMNSSGEQPPVTVVGIGLGGYYALSMLTLDYGRDHSERVISNCARCCVVVNSFACADSRVMGSLRQCAALHDRIAAVLEALHRCDTDLLDVTPGSKVHAQTIQRRAHVQELAADAIVALRAVLYSSTLQVPPHGLSPILSPTSPSAGARVHRGYACFLRQQRYLPSVTAQLSRLGVPLLRIVGTDDLVIAPSSLDDVMSQRRHVAKASFTPSDLSQFCLSLRSRRVGEPASDFASCDHFLQGGHDTMRERASATAGVLRRLIDNTLALPTVSDRRASLSATVLETGKAPAVIPVAVMHAAEHGLSSESSSAFPALQGVPPEVPVRMSSMSSLPQEPVVANVAGPHERRYATLVTSMSKLDDDISFIDVSAVASLPEIRHTDTGKLQAELKKRGLSVAGETVDLIARLDAALTLEAQRAAGVMKQRNAVLALATVDAFDVVRSGGATVEILDDDSVTSGCIASSASEPEVSEAVVAVPLATAYEQVISPPTTLAWKQRAIDAIQQLIDGCQLHHDDGHSMLALLLREEEREALFAEVVSASRTRAEIATPIIDGMYEQVTRAVRSASAHVAALLQRLPADAELLNAPGMHSTDARAITASVRALAVHTRALRSLLSTAVHQFTEAARVWKAHRLEVSSLQYRIETLQKMISGTGSAPQQAEEAQFQYQIAQLQQRCTARVSHMQLCVLHLVTNLSLQQTLRKRATDCCAGLRGAQVQLGMALQDARQRQRDAVAVLEVVHARRQAFAVQQAEATARLAQFMAERQRLSRVTSMFVASSIMDGSHRTLPTTELRNWLDSAILKAKLSQAQTSEADIALEQAWHRLDQSCRAAQDDVSRLSRTLPFVRAEIQGTEHVADSRIGTKYTELLQEAQSFGAAPRSPERHSTTTMAQHAIQFVERVVEDVLQSKDAQAQLESVADVGAVHAWGWRTQFELEQQELCAAAVDVAVVRGPSHLLRLGARMRQQFNEGGSMPLLLDADTRSDDVVDDVTDGSASLTRGLWLDPTCMRAVMTRCKAAAERTPDEKSWIACDRVMFPALYASSSHEDRAVYAADPSYKCSASAVLLQRLAQLPCLPELALSQCCDETEFKLYALLCTYLHGTGEGAHRWRDQGSPALVISSLMDARALVLRHQHPRERPVDANAYCAIDAAMHPALYRQVRELKEREIKAEHEPAEVLVPATPSSDIVRANLSPGANNGRSTSVLRRMMHRLRSMTGAAGQSAPDVAPGTDSQTALVVHTPSAIANSDAAAAGVTQSPDSAVVISSTAPLEVPRQLEDILRKAFDSTARASLWQQARRRPMTVLSQMSQVHDVLQSAATDKSTSGDVDYASVASKCTSALLLQLADPPLLFQSRMPPITLLQQLHCGMEAGATHNHTFHVPGVLGEHVAYSCARRAGASLGATQDFSDSVVRAAEEETMCRGARPVVVSLCISVTFRGHAPALSQYVPGRVSVEVYKEPFAQYDADGGTIRLCLPWAEQSLLPADHCASMPMYECIGEVPAPTLRQRVAQLHPAVLEAYHALSPSHEEPRLSVLERQRIGYASVAESSPNTTSNVGRLVIRHTPSSLPVVPGAYCLCITGLAPCTYSVSVSANVAYPLHTAVEGLIERQDVLRNDVRQHRADARDISTALRLGERKAALVQFITTQLTARVASVDAAMQRLTRACANEDFTEDMFGSDDEREHRSTAAATTAGASNVEHELQRRAQTETYLLRARARLRKLHERNEDLATTLASWTREGIDVAEGLAALREAQRAVQAHLEEALEQLRDSAAALPDVHDALQAVDEVDACTKAAAAGISAWPHASLDERLHQRMGPAFLRWRDSWRQGRGFAMGATPAEHVRNKRLTELSEEERIWMSADRILHPELYDCRRYDDEDTLALPEASPGVQVPRRTEQPTAPRAEQGSLTKPGSQLPQWPVLHRDMLGDSTPQTVLDRVLPKCEFSRQELLHILETAFSHLTARERRMRAILTRYPDQTQDESAASIPEDVAASGHRNASEGKPTSRGPSSVRQLLMLRAKERAARWHAARSAGHDIVDNTFMLTDTDARARRVLAELDRAQASSDEFVDSAVLHGEFQRYSRPQLVTQLQMEVDQLLLSQVMERESAERTLATQAHRARSAIDAANAAALALQKRQQRERMVHRMILQREQRLYDAELQGSLESLGRRYLLTDDVYQLRAQRAQRIQQLTQTVNAADDNALSMAVSQTAASAFKGIYDLDPSDALFRLGVLSAWGGTSNAVDATSAAVTRAAVVAHSFQQVQIDASDAAEAQADRRGVRAAMSIVNQILGGTMARVSVELLGAAQPASESSSQMMEQQLCRACGVVGCHWKATTLAHGVTARLVDVENELLRVRRVPNDDVSVTMVESDVSLSYLRGGPSAQSKPDLISELASESAELKERLRVAKADEELHALYALPDHVHDVTIHVHGYPQRLRRLRAITVVEAEVNKIVAMLTASEVVGDVLEWMLEGWHFGECDSRQAIAGRVPRRGTNSVIRPTEAATPDLLALSLTGPAASALAVDVERGLAPFAELSEASVRLRRAVEPLLHVTATGTALASAESNTAIVPYKQSRELATVSVEQEQDAAYGLVGHATPTIRPAYQRIADADRVAWLDAAARARSKLRAYNSTMQEVAELMDTTETTIKFGMFFVAFMFARVMLQVAALKRAWAPGAAALKARLHTKSSLAEDLTSPEISGARRRLRAAQEAAAARQTVSALAAAKALRGYASRAAAVVAASRADVHRRLEMQHKARVEHDGAVALQRVWRSYTARRQVVRDLAARQAALQEQARRVAAAIRIQGAWRGYVERLLMADMKAELLAFIKRVRRTMAAEVTDAYYAANPVERQVRALGTAIAARRKEQARIRVAMQRHVDDASVSAALASEQARALRSRLVPRWARRAVDDDREENGMPADGEMPKGLVVTEEVRPRSRREAKRSGFAASAAQ